MQRPMMLYRGILKSCNYHCSYCPFSKHPASKRELEKDREQWLHFVRTLEKHADTLNIHALMVVPYGEALVHPWYWEGLGRLCASPAIDAVGAQTNLSFPIEASLARFTGAGGNLKKLRLWATFHPEMTTAENFANSCRKIRTAGVSICGGAVGVPENIHKIRRLREKLPKETYLWINRMDGMKRNYTPEEKNALLEIDPYFERELTLVPADCSRCHGRLFAEGSGKLRTCNISPALEHCWDELCTQAQRNTALPYPDLPSPVLPLPQCRRKSCTCYLAYGGRDDFINQVLFGPYPLFRIPRRPKAVFLDIEGTLFPQKGSAEVPSSVWIGLEALTREQVPLFFATTLPYETAMKRCRGIRHLFSGGIFAGGAHVKLDQKDGNKEYFYDLGQCHPAQSCLDDLERLKKIFHYRILPYKTNGRIYKITLFRPRHLPWGRQEAEKLAATLPILKTNAVRYFVEDHCLQIVPAEATKENGVRILCWWLGIPPEETAAAGDSVEDRGMLALCGM